MNRKKPAATKQLSVSGYILTSVVGFLVSLFCVYYYLQYIQGSVSEGVSQRIFYLVLILFGISASAMVFGAMNSYGILSGQKLDTKFRFAGPVVGVLLVVLGGFYLPKAAAKQTLAFRVAGAQQTPVTSGRLTLYFPHHTREEAINEKGTAVFSDIDDEELTSKVKVDVQSEGYDRLTFDTLLKGFSPVTLVLSPNKMVRLSGKITDADDRPLKDVEVVVEGTRFFAHTVNDGTYTLQLSGETIGDEITLVTSHKEYKDKAKSLKIDRIQMAPVDFVLQPLLKTSH